MSKKKWAITSCLVLALGLSACSNGNIENNSQPEDNNVESNVESNNNVDNNTENNDKVDVNDVNKNAEQVDPTFSGKYGEVMSGTEAYDVFMDENINAKVVKMELDYNNESYIYEIEGFDEKNSYQTKIDGITGKILEHKEKDRDKDIEAIAKHYIQRADELVKNALQDSREDIKSLEWDLEIEDGKSEIEIEIERTSGEIEYTYDLETGKLLEKDR